MAKTKAKKNKITLPPNSSNDATFLGLSNDNIKQIGVAVAGAVVAELAGLLTQKLTQSSNQKDSIVEDDQDSTDRSNPIQASVSGLETAADRVGSAIAEPMNATQSTIAEVAEDIKPVVDHSVEGAKSARDRITPAFAGVVDSLKTAAQKAIEQTNELTGTRTSTMVEDAVDTAINFASTINSLKQPPSGKQEKKKKKKKAKK
ncbi:MAG: hypothetical protein IGS48_16110 [Oscillatoriales cyanobacterium C42_A2020_001]|nr:hypothetical protein [Leptolyngbyaceae cyanobacterium C42_A2020_001]